MSRITIELEPETAAKVRRAAEDEGLSLSQWVTRLVEANIGEVKGAKTWPDEVRALAGAAPDFPEVEEIQREYSAKKSAD